MMGLLAFALAAQLAAPAMRAVPVLSFPERGLDDSAAYLGYQTRLFRDASGNTLQIYLDSRADRVVHLWADAEDESFGFTARGASGRAANLEWDAPDALVSRTSRTRTVEHALVANNARISVGWFILGSMRVERDLQYANRQKTRFANARFTLPEYDRMLAALASLTPAERRAQLALLNARSVGALRARLRPTVTARASGSAWVTRVAQPALDGLDTMVLELRTDPRRVTTAVRGDSVTMRARSGDRIPFTVRITTSGKALAPLTRDEIFNARFLTFLENARAEGARAGARSIPALRAQRLERQVRGLELLASREKLMAGLPTYATYFGRDMLMTALMMKPVWRDEMYEFVIASVLRKLNPAGRVSHEEALGGQAVREAASEYAALIGTWSTSGRPDSLLVRARAVLRDVRRVRENYHMIDAEYQFPIVVARWLTDVSVLDDRKRAFLMDRTDSGEPRVTRLLRELSLVARTTSSYASNPIPQNLVAFAERDSGKWAPQSWRDSNVGYGGGRYAMDVNVVWAPHALESVALILDALRTLGISTASVETQSALGAYVRDPQRLRRAVATWKESGRHFIVQLPAAEVRNRTRARLAAMTAEERRHWESVLARTHADADSLTFLALALDGVGRPIHVASSDAATRLFLGESESQPSVPDAKIRADVLRDVRLFTRSYPVGLLVDGVGPAVASDAFATPAIWADFERDRYHGPKVVWGRENNLFLIGAINRIDDARGNAELEPYVRELRAAIDTVLHAVEASGFHSELWSYEVRDGRAVPIRYGSGSDVQLWSTTDLVVQYARSLMRP